MIEKFKEFKLILLSKLLLLLLPISILVSNAAINLVTFLLFINCLLIFFFERNFYKNYFLNKLLYYFFFWYTFLFFISLFSYYVIYTIPQLILYIRFLSIPIIVLYVFFNDRNYVKKYFYYFTIIILFVLIDSFLQIFLKINVTLNEYQYGSRLSGLFGDEKILGVFLFFSLPIIFIALYFFEQKKNNKILHFIFFILLLVLFFTSFYTGERVALTKIFISIIFYFFIFFKKFTTRLIAIIIIFVSIFYQYNFNDLFKERLKLTVDITHGTFNKFDNFRFFSPTHHAYMESSIKMFNNNIVTGVGFKSYKKVCDNPKYIITNKRFFEIMNRTSEDLDESYLLKSKNCSTHPHNIILQSLSETGLIATLIIFIYYLLLIWFFIKKLIIPKNESKNLKVIVLALILYLLPILPSSNMFGTLFSVYLYLYLAFFIYFYYLDNSLSKSKKY